MVQTSARMQLHNLVVFDGQIVASALKMRCLHEEASDQSLPDINIILSAFKVCARPLQFESVHDSRQLCSHVIGTLKRAKVHKIVIAPVWIFMVLTDIIKF